MSYEPVIWGVHTAEAYMEECEILKFSYALWKLLPEVELDYDYWGGMVMTDPNKELG